MPRLTTAALLLVAPLLGRAEGAGLTAARGQETSQGEAPRPAPDFERPTYDGGRVRLSRYRGKAVLLNFWATWCEPCRAETPWLVKLSRVYGPRGLQVVGIDMEDDRADVLRFVRAAGIRYPVVQGDDALAALFGGLRGLPTSIYVDRRGLVVGETFGLTDAAEIESRARQALGLPPPGPGR
jgi:cytochrome c biogenesis protein CcmG/thiol:disulfide interchange protein DsbE